MKRNGNKLDIFGNKLPLKEIDSSDRPWVTLTNALNSCPVLELQRQ